MAERILLIEDEVGIADFLKRGLIYEGYRVDVAYDGQQGLDMARDTPPDMVILDWMLPGLDGLEVCKRLRAASDVPILMLTAKSEEIDRVVGLEMGADDYLVKPFGPRELVARVRAVLRRGSRAMQPPDRRFAFGDFVIDLDARQLVRRPSSADERGVRLARVPRAEAATRAHARSDSRLDARPQRGPVRPHRRHADLAAAAQARRGEPGIESHRDGA